MKARPLPDSALLHALYRYEDGRLFHKMRPAHLFSNDRKQAAAHNAAIWNGKYAGSPADICVTSNGYARVNLLGASYGVHRVIYKMHHGVDPDDVDHINGVRTDNRIENLRSVSRSINLRNAAGRPDNTSGHVGVSWYPPRQKWNAYINTNGVRKNLGYYDTFEGAVCARKAAEEGKGFTSRHGERAIHNVEIMVTM